MLARAASTSRHLALRAVVVLVVIASLGWANPQRVNAAEPVGWRPLFSESFDGGGTLPAACTPIDGPQDAGYFRPDEVRVSGDALRLRMQRRAFGGRAYTIGGVRCGGLTQQYGRYEFLATVPAGAGVEATAELGVDAGAPGRQASAVRVLARPGDERMHVFNGYGAAETSRSFPGRYSGEGHTYLIEWAPSGFRVFVDGQERFVDARVSVERRWFGFAVRTGDPLTGQPDASTRLPVEFSIEYLRVWAYDPAASPSTVDNTRSPAAAAPVPARGRDWSGWLAGFAIAALVVAGGALFLHKTRPHRPRPGHRV
jgi:hypothetical protein